MDIVSARNEKKNVYQNLALVHFQQNDLLLSIASNLFKVIHVHSLRQQTNRYQAILLVIIAI